MQQSNMVGVKYTVGVWPNRLLCNKARPKMERTCGLYDQASAVLCLCWALALPAGGAARSTPVQRAPCAAQPT
jgi:hypothetical protein